MNNNSLFLKNVMQFIFLLLLLLSSYVVIEYLWEKNFSPDFFLYLLSIPVFIFSIIKLEFEKINGNPNKGGLFILPPEEGINPPIKLEVSHPRKFLLIL